MLADVCSRECIFALGIGHWAVLFTTTMKETCMSENQTAVTPKVELTKEEKISRLKKEIARLETKLFNVENDIVEVKAKKEVALPAVGADVLFNYGRKTATTDPVQKIGRVVAIKPAGVTAEGKKTPAQIKVSVGTDFEQEFVVIYPAQIADAGPATE